MHIQVDDLSDPQVLALLAEHLASMHEITPAEHVYALDVGEIKSMRTPSARRGRGAGRAILNHLLAVARERGYVRVSLETGSHPACAPAQALYRSVGFQPAGCFGAYRESPDNVFMTLELTTGES